MNAPHPGVPADTADERPHTRFGPDPPELDAAVKLLAELVEDAGEPVEPLLETLLGGGTVERVLDGAPVGGVDLARVLPAGASAEDLAAMKARARESWKTAGTRAASDAALLRYLLAVAAGLAHHRVNLSSLPRDTLPDWFGTLATLVDEPHAGLFREAAAALSRLAARREEQAGRPPDPGIR